MYYGTPVVSSYIPSVAPADGGTPITVVGRNFAKGPVDSPVVNCSFGNYIVIAGYRIDDFTVVCPAPAKNLTFDTFIEVAINGVDYTSNKVLFRYFEILDATPRCAPADG